MLGVWMTGKPTFQEPWEMMPNDTDSLCNIGLCTVQPLNALLALEGFIEPS
jgi:hypothetical protein